MAATDYRCQNKEEIAKIPLIAHKIIVAKHKRTEFALSVALAISVITGIINLVL
jgi:hypothetical protein